MQRFLRLGSLIGIAAIVSASEPALGQAPQVRKFVSGELVVGFTDTASRQSAYDEMRSRAVRGPAERSVHGGVPMESVPLSGNDMLVRIPVVRRATERSVSPIGEAATRAGELTQIIEAGLEFVRTIRGAEYAHPNWIVDNEPASMVVKPAGLPSVPSDDPAFEKQHWHYRASPGGINLARAWARTKGSSDVVVAVLDTGILFDHPDFLRSNILPGYDFVASEPYANDGDGRDANPTDPGTGAAAGLCGQFEPESANSWHGTHVAGTIGAAATNNGAGMASINWQVKVLPVRVLGRCGGRITDVVDGIRWAAGLEVPGVPSNGNPAHVINLSLQIDNPCSVQEYGTLRNAIAEAIAAGAVVVAAAGNRGWDVANVSPSGCPGPITVAASDQRGRLVLMSENPVYASNYGERVDILAPGGNLSRDDDGDQLQDGVWSAVSPTQGGIGIAAMEGTSMAAPHVSGVIALGMAADPALRRQPSLVLERLKGTAAPLASGQCSKKCGAGFLDADRFVGAASGGSRASSAPGSAQ